MFHVPASWIDGWTDVASDAPTALLACLSEGFDRLAAVLTLRDHWEYRFMTIEVKFGVRVIPEPLGFGVHPIILRHGHGVDPFGGVWSRGTCDVLTSSPCVCLV